MPRSSKPKSQKPKAKKPVDAKAKQVRDEFMRYIEEHDIANLVWNIVVECYEHRATDPKRFILELLQNMEPETVQSPPSAPKEKIDSSPGVDTNTMDPEGDETKEPKPKRAKKHQKPIDDNEATKQKETIGKTLNFISQNSSGPIGNIESGPSPMTRSRRDSIFPSTSSKNQETSSDSPMQPQSEVASRLLTLRPKNH